MRKPLLSGGIIRHLVIPLCFLLVTSSTLLFAAGTTHTITLKLFAHVPERAKVTFDTGGHPELQTNIEQDEALELTSYTLVAEDEEYKVFCIEHI